MARQLFDREIGAIIIYRFYSGGDCGFDPAEPRFGGREDGGEGGGERERTLRERECVRHELKAGEAKALDIPRLGT